MARDKEDATAAKERNEARLQLYNQVVTDARLRKLMLSDLTFKVNRELDVSSSKPTMQFEGILAAFSFDAEAKAIAATIEWIATQKQGRKVYSKCAAQYHIIYDGFTVEDEDILERFAFNVGRPATYTYFRALFASLDWAAELRNPPLPVVKFFPKI